MLSDYVWDQRARARLQGTKLEANLDAFVAYLEERGHAARTVTMYGQVAGHFARWLSLRVTRLETIDDTTLRWFLDQHLPRCRCPAPRPRSRITVRAALHHFLTVLRRDGQAAPKSSPVSPTIATAITSYDDYLRETCGLADNTRLYRRRYVREFLEATTGDGLITTADLQPEEIERFVTMRARRCCPGSAQVLASSLRSWLRYQQLLGECGAHLVAAVPRIPQSRLADIPKVLADDDVRRLLDAIDVSTSTGRRDYAMARCLIDLGLRAIEVAQLLLDDVDWRRGRILIRRTKTRRADWLPLPRQLGQSLAAYLRRGRPVTTTRALFVRHYAPVGIPIGPSVVRQALRRAAEAAGLGDRWRGPHVLRHTIATRLLRGGASLKEIADVLRHRSFDTTTIYAKVDLAALRPVALPWPGEER